MKKISVIGAGAWGTTLSILLAEKGHEVVLWIFEKELAKQMQELRENKTFLPGFQLQESILITNELKDTKGSEILIFAVPTQFLRGVAKQFKHPKSIVVSASKGIELNTLKLPLDILKEELKTKELATLSGPNLSAEIAKGLPSASVIASISEEVAKAVQESLMLERFRVYTNFDPLGVQLGGALKNVIAIAAGIADGLELGNNAKASLLIRGMAEITRLGLAMGAHAKTFAGLSGIGDVIATCTSTLSRNHFVGEEIAKGKKLDEILACMKDVAEGVPTSQAALELSDKNGVELPLTRNVFEVLYKGKKPYKALTELMTRSATSE